MTTNVGEYLCVGDSVCLYSVETEGYTYSLQSSSVHSHVYIYQNQDRDKPKKIPSAQACEFIVGLMNRYKLNKKYRKHLSLAANPDGTFLEDENVVRQHKMAAEAENMDNAQEQKRQLGKRIRYGEILQLKHMYTNKYIHTCTSQTSQVDKNNMVVMLQEYNAKNAQFRILPQYKVKSEGEVVQIYDQIVFESIKSPGHFIHASSAFQIDHFTFGSELNLGVERSGFTLIRFRKRPPAESLVYIRGGNIVRLFHKELEAYIVAEGLFDDEITEDVHFRIRVMDQHKPRTLSPPTSGNTYWVIEAEKGFFFGEIIQWEQQIRLRHLTTRKYMCITSEHEVVLVDSNEDPRTVFRLHSVINEKDEIRFESYCRIEHVLTGTWLHALKDEDYIRKQFRDAESVNDQSLKGLRVSSAPVKRITGSSESQYDDAFTIQRVEDVNVGEFNYVSGMVPFLQNLIKDRELGIVLNSKKTHTVVTAMDELQHFMIMLDNTPSKQRQKLMRNLRVIDLLVKILQFPLDGAPDEHAIIHVFKEAYEVLYTYMIGKSRKNALYFAKYIEFFQTQFTQKGGIGLNVAQMIVELIRDKRKIVDRISHQQIDEFVGLLQTTQNYRFLDLLHVLCVCDDIAIPNNQVYIVQQWMQNEPRGIYLTARGQDINKQPNILYITTDDAKTWSALHDFVNHEHEDYNKDKHDFLLHQLDLFIALCRGRNDYAINIITKESRFLTWEETFLALRSTILPDSIRAKYCDITTNLFVDIGNNYSVLAYPNICFVYDYVGSKDEEKSAGDFIMKELVAIFPVLRDWIAEFLSENQCMYASEIGHNMLIEQVLRLLYYLVKFGYYMDSEDVDNLLPPLLNLLDGRHDYPFPAGEKNYTKEEKKKVHQYQQADRFEKTKETEAISRAKFQVLEVLDLLLTYQRNLRLQSFVGKFKIAELLEAEGKTSIMVPLLYDLFDPHDQTKKALGVQKKVNKELNDMFKLSALFDLELLTKVLMDLSMYKDKKMVLKSMTIMNKLYSTKCNMFNIGSQAQILLTQDSARVHREVLKNMPVLRRLANAKLDDLQIKMMGNILDDLAEFCHLPMTPDEPHPMNQNILISNGVLDVLFTILEQDIDPKLMSVYGGMADIFKKSFYLLKLLARENFSVQLKIMERMDIMLDVKVVESDLAIALKEVFNGNQFTCLKISQKQIQKIVTRVAELQEKAPEFLDLLGMVVKVTGLNLTLKRNQAYVMKYVMQSYRRVAFVLDMSREERITILTDTDEIARLRYYISLLDLLAACAEGENMFIESLCQTILPIDDLMMVLNSDKVDNVYKKPFLKCLHHVYMKIGDNQMDTGASELSHFEDIWHFISIISIEMNKLTDSIKADPDKMATYINCAPEKSGQAAAPDFESSSFGTMLYFLEGVLPFLTSFYQYFYYPEKHSHPNELDETDHIAKAVVLFGEILGPLIHKPLHMKNISEAVTTLVPISNMPNSNIEGILGRWAGGITAEDTSSAIRKGNIEYYSDEVELNAKFRAFTRNCSIVFAGHNTVTAQLGYRSQREYTILGGDEELPLGEEFQSLVKCFINPSEKKTAKKYEWAAKLIELLNISSSFTRLSEQARQEMDELNIKCLQILRAMVHNEERKLPEDWPTRTTEPKVAKTLRAIGNIQKFYDTHSAMMKILPHLATRNEQVAKETLGFLCALLLNANRTVQESMMQYFLSTKEEVFFMAIRDRMSCSTNTIKEKRSLVAQMDVQKKKSASKIVVSKAEKASVSSRALEQILKYETALRIQRLNGWKPKRNGPRKLEKIGEKVDDDKETEAKKDKKKPPEKKKDKKPSKTDNKAKKKTKETENGPTTKDDLALINEAFEDNEAGEVKVEIPDEVDDKKDAEKAEEAKDQTQDDTNSDDEEGENAMMAGNDGYIELALKVMARMCDGQNHTLQDYLRDQPDNVKSFNIVSEVTHFLNVMYSNINARTIDLVIQLFDTMTEFTADYLREQPDNVKSFNIIGEVTQFLNVIYSNITAKTIDLVCQLFDTMTEFTAGNQENRIVIYDNKIIDYINFIIRAGEIGDCPIDKVLTLRESISNLVLALVEENGLGKTQVALEVKDSLDKKAVLRLMTECFEHHGIDKKKLAEMKYMEEEGVPMVQKKSKVAVIKEKLLRSFGKKDIDEFAEEYEDVGYRLYLILARMIDIDVHLLDSLRMTPLQLKAYTFYKKNCQSIEIVKDDDLQKANFRVKTTRVLRDEVKEMLKWSVDRSSPSNKIRDLMEWSVDIMKDIAYQRKILNNPIAVLITKGWLVWNNGVTILSFAINILMLLTWNAKASLNTSGIYKNTTAIPPEVKDPIPEISNLSPDQYTMALFVLGGMHNTFCFLVVISYFVGNHPRLPDPKAAFLELKDYILSKKKEDEDGEDDKTKEHVPKMEAKLFSFKTFYYLCFFALSVGGTLFHGYFFAFHLLNIVNGNQLLSGVIKAVTQNGRSLVWVGILGLCVFYLYAIISFALMRSMFDPNDYLYCDTLWQCTLTIIRYGLIGDLFDNIKAHKTEKDFRMFGFVVLYHVSFFIFITTIGLNIIFGIIVDTFSELRDLKWTAESDMRDTCFICSRNSYDFEHHGNGFDQHVRYEHNMWAYIFFFIHLDQTKLNDYTALEMYVFKHLQKENYDFFPLDRALSLAAMGQDSTEVKIDDLLYHVTSIVQKQKKEELEKKRLEEKMRQAAWEERHRLVPISGGLHSIVANEDYLAINPEQDDQFQDTLAVGSPPQGLSPTYSRRTSVATGTRRPSAAGSGYQTPLNRHDRYRRRRSVSPMDQSLFRIVSPSRGIDDDQVSQIYGWEERIHSPTLFGLEEDIFDIIPVSYSRRQSVDMLRSPRLSIAPGQRELQTYYSESDPTPYLRQLAHQFSQERERRLSQQYPEGQPLTLPPEADRGDVDSIGSDDIPPDTQF